MADAELQLTGNDPLSYAVEDMLARGASPAGPLAAIGELMVGSTQQTIEMGGRPETFAPWSTKPYPDWVQAITGFANYAESRGGGKVLIKSSALLNSIDYEVNDAEVAWGTNVKYAARMNFGWLAGSADETPAREFVKPPFPEDWDTIREILYQWVFE